MMIESIDGAPIMPIVVQQGALDGGGRLSLGLLSFGSLPPMTIGFRAATLDVVRGLLVSGPEELAIVPR